MKYLAIVAAVVAPFALSAELVLDDGTRITIKPDEKVYITTKKLYTRGKKVDPIDIDGDVVVVPVDPVDPITAECSVEYPELCAEGSVEYCTYNQEAWDGTPTFDSQDWLDRCDTNSNGLYKYCEDYIPFQNGFTFEDQNFVRFCSKNPDFNPVL